jgi:hypothetical protein
VSDVTRYFLVTSKGSASVVLTDGQNVTLRSPFPAPPGCPLAGTLNDTSHLLRVKVHGCRRIVEDATPNSNLFEITGRWVSLSREVRLLLTGQPPSE